MSTPIILPPNTDVLMNRGVQLRVHKLDERGERIFDAENQPELELVWMHINNKVLATIEAPPPMGWGSLDGWEDALDKQPFRTVVATFAICRNLFVPDPGGLPTPDVERAASMLQDRRVQEYSIVLMNALMLAQGVSTEGFREAVEVSLKALKEGQERLNVRMLQKLRENDSAEDDATPTSPPPIPLPSDGGTENGQNLGDQSMSTGN